MIVKSFLFVIVVFGVAWAQNDLESLDGAFNSLPPELQGKVDESQVKELRNKSIEAFGKKCEENGGPEAFANAEKGLRDFQACLEGLVNKEELEREIEEAKPNGQVDEVFKKYCQKTPQFKQCFHSLTETTKPCFSVPEKKNLKTVYNVTEQLAEFVCYKEGDRIALFIAEGGRECIEGRQEELQICANNTIGGSGYEFNPKTFSPESIPQIKFGEEECKKMTALQTCVVQSLMKCPQPTTANIAESLFKFVRKATPCKDFGEKIEEAKPRSQKADPEERKPGSANGVTIASMTVVMAVVTALFV